MHLFIYKYIQKLQNYYNVSEQDEQIACKLSEVMLSTFLELSTLLVFWGFLVVFFF